MPRLPWPLPSARPRRQAALALAIAHAAPPAPDDGDPALRSAMVNLFRREGFGELHRQVERIRRDIACENRTAVDKEGWIA